MTLCLTGCALGVHSILGPPACWQMPLGLQGKPTCLLQWSHSGDPLGLGSQLHLTLLSEVRASVEPPSSSVSPSEKNGHLDNSHLCMLLGTTCCGQARCLVPAVTLRAKEASLCNAILSQSHIKAVTQTLERDLLLHTRAIGSCGPLSLPYSTLPKPGFWGRQSQAALRAAQPILT